ncbi:MAG TPA: hydrogenase maturation protease [Gemmatimonadaceae bacterium]
MFSAPGAARLSERSPSRVPAKPILVVGLGNPMAGDDGVGFRAAEALALDSRLPPEVEVLCGGADVLRLAPWFEGRDRVLFVDACLGVHAGEVQVVPHDEARLLGSSRPHAHRLSPVEGVELLLRVTPGMHRDDIRWALVGVRDVRHGDALSPGIAAAMPAITERLLAALAEP